MAKLKNKSGKNKKIQSDDPLAREVDEVLGSSARRDKLLQPTSPISDDLYGEHGETRLDFGGDRKKRPRASAIRIVFWVLLIVLLLVIAGAVFIAEPWVVPMQDAYTDPKIESLAPITVEVGAEHLFDISLDENERISDMKLSDTEIVKLSEEGVTGLGEYFEPVILSITTMEKEVPKREPAHSIVIGVRDLSQLLEKTRNWLRNITGIEKTQPERTELRVLHRYEQEIEVSGLDPVTDTADHAIEAYLQNPVTVEFALNEGESFAISVQNEKTATATLIDSDQNTAFAEISGVAAGKTKVVALTGFWKTVNKETFARYLEVTGKAEPEKAGDLTARTEGEEAQDVEPVKMRIFVPTRQSIMAVSSIDLNEPVVQTELDAKPARRARDMGWGANLQLAKETLESVNKVRKDKGLSLLEWSNALEKSAAMRAVELSGQFSHMRPDGADGRKAADTKAELIAGGYESADTAVDAWLASPSMREQLLDGQAKTFACAMYRNTANSYANYWCVLLG
ncbi:MAG: CAP domain-containing protein [Oscillospiraceae bacterium]